MLGTVASSTLPGRNVQTDFGAAGDGITDDTAELQAALDSGDPLYLPPGVYLISDVLVYDSGCTVAGAGHSAIIRNTTTRTGWTRMLTPNGVGVTDATFRDFTLDQRGDIFDTAGDDPNDLLMSVDATTRARIHRVKFMNARAMAVWADSFPANPTTYTEVDHCEVTSAGGGGFSFFGEFSNFAITDNTVSNTQDDAIAVQSTDWTSSEGVAATGVITGNVIRDCDTRTTYGSTPHGVMVFGADNVTVAGNDIDSTYSSGIQVSDGGGRNSSYVDVTGNRIRSAGTNNPGTETPAYGLFLLNSDHITLAGNDVADCLHGNYHEDGCTDVVKDF